jgi:DNA polymerase-3 subunit gamma/tau
LQKQAKLVETDRLLELIEQFAGAEGRMKWSPNKKLHFEVAVIKAIHTLGQATLDQVIENLAALRDGKEVSMKKAVAGVADAGSAAVSDRSYNEPAPRVAEKNEPSGSTMEPDELWQKIAPKVPQKSFLRTLIDSVTVPDKELAEPVQDLFNEALRNRPDLNQAAIQVTQTPPQLGFDLFRNWRF